MTAKHVLYENGRIFANLLMRINKVGVGSEMRKVGLTLDGSNQNVWFHPDGVSDAVVIRIKCPDPEVYDIVLLSADMILTKQAVDDYRMEKQNSLIRLF